MGLDHSLRATLPRFALTIFCLCSPNSPVSSAEQDAAIDFNRDVRPILSDHCFQCHGPDQAKREAGLRLDSLADATADLGDHAAIVAGDAESSELFLRIEDADDPMPPAETNNPLSENQKSILRQWIEQGAAYADHWAFVRPVRPPVPIVSTQIENPIDAFVAARLTDRDLSFSAEADPRTLIRRVTLDLIGLPPSPAEVERFSDDYHQHGEAAYQRLLDRLIHSPRYGETMALPWLDAARFADTDGYQYDGPRFQWRYRDWVIDAYNSNKPFDEFTIEQLAGDLIPNATLDQQIATAFNRNHRYNSEAGLVVEEFLLENAVDRVDTTSTLWMGLTMGCARCHDHKFDPISQREYYQLVAFFNSVPESGRAIKSGNSEPVCLAPTDPQLDRLRELEQAVARARRALRTQKMGTQKIGTQELKVDELGVTRGLEHFFAMTTVPAVSATAVGQPSFADGHLGLDGQSSVQIKDLDGSMAFRASQRFTVSFWIRPQAVRAAVILSRQNPGTTRPGIEIAITDDGQLRFDLITRWLAGVGRVTAVQPLPVGVWSHVAVSNDGSQSAGGQSIFINGQRTEVEIGYNTNSNVGGVKGNRPLIVGDGIRDDARPLKGSLKSIALFSESLWPEEIEVLALRPGDPKGEQFASLASTAAYTQYVSARERLDAYRRSLPTVMVMQETSSPKATFVRQRGVYNKLGDRVQRDVPAMLPPMPEHFPRNRLGLAKWLVSPEHPLTARVAVNRYWQKYFGKGLVKTPEDFGTQSEPPTHPKLLDWLAVEFIESGWDVAAMQRLIVSSRTYRQRSTVSEKLLEIDPENVWLARAPRLRLNAHAIRDSALAVSGLLAENIGGPSVSPYQPKGLWAEMSMGMKYRQSKGQDLFRRSLYTIWKRTVAPPTMAVFDAADRESCWVGRKETNTPLQALTLLNETGFVESARHLAAKMMNTDDPIGFGFQAVTARKPTTQERHALEEALTSYRKQFAAAPERADELVRVGESPESTRSDPVQLAAYTMVANCLLNLDEAITRE